MHGNLNASGMVICMFLTWLFACFSRDHFLIRDFYNAIIHEMKQYHFNAMIIMLILLKVIDATLG